MSGFHPFGGRVSRQFGEKLNANEMYLTYGDANLTREDVRVLKDDWLTDNVISFWQEYLEREHLAKEHTANIVLLRPSMSYMLMQTPEPDDILDFLPDFTRTTHIFLPMNDNQHPDMAGGGNHWSLLLVSVLDNIAFHYDSLSPSRNGEGADFATRQLGRMLRRPLRFVDLPDSPKQENGNDCGVFVCLQMRHLLLKKLLMVESGRQVSMSMAGKHVNASQGRKDMLRTIETCKKEVERRRSRSSSPLKPASKTSPRID